MTWRKGREVDLEAIADTAMASGCPSVERVVVLRRSARPTHHGWLDWRDFLALGDGHDGGFVELEANEPAYILATSGTTARPKLAVHTHGPHQVHVHAMGRWCFGMRPDDVWWATSDIGWVVGHSYIVYAPLLFGCTTIAYEGALDHPDAGTVYRIVEENRISGIFTSPTAVRLLMRYGAEPSCRHDLSSVERVVCAGEVLNPPAWEWFQKEVFADRIPVMDYMWQTETSGPIVGNPYGCKWTFFLTNRPLRTPGSLPRRPRRTRRREPCHVPAAPARTPSRLGCIAAPPIAPKRDDARRPVARRPARGGPPQPRCTPPTHRPPWEEAKRRAHGDPIQQ